MPLPISEIALVEPVPKEPFWTTPEPDGTITQAIYTYSPNQHTRRRWYPRDNKGKGGKRVLPFSRADEDSKWENGAGDDPWPLFTPVPIKGFEDKVLPEVEGERCSRLMAEAGFANISQPGCKHSEPLIADRYAEIKESGVRYVAYLADNDEVGRKKAAKCARAAASVGLPFISIDLVELFPDLPEGGSVDDMPDIREAMQLIADALPSQLPAQVDYDNEPEPVIPRDPEESPAQADLPQGQTSSRFHLGAVAPQQPSSGLIAVGSRTADH